VINERPLALLGRIELERLMRLAIEAAEFASLFNKHLVRRYHALAAQCGLELWWRDWTQANSRLATLVVELRHRPTLQ